MTVEGDVELILQALIVALIVVASATFAAWRLMPARTRLRVLDWLNPSDANALSRRLLRLRKSVHVELTQGGCGSCSHAADHVQKHAAPKRP
jgi:hypothetical protein